MTVILEPAHETRVGETTVRRSLPRHGRRTIGAWCFVDHFGPERLPPSRGMQVGPHPHIGLQTVTWLVAGEVRHTDSLGSDTPIRPGQLNVMTAGRGVAHAEQTPSAARGDLHGVQLWVAQPEPTRHGPPDFEHHAELPAVELDGATATVLLGSLAGVTSPARADSPIVGADIALRGTGELPLEPGFEHGVIVLDGEARVDGQVVTPGIIAYMEPGRDELTIRAEAPARVLLIGGPPFSESVLMWWNFVARTREEIEMARTDWQASSERFGPVDSDLAVIPAPPIPWTS